MLHNGIPILNALRIAKDSTGNKVLSEAIDQAADNITAGNSLAAPLTACKYFPRDLVANFLQTDNASCNSCVSPNGNLHDNSSDHSATGNRFPLPEESEGYEWAYLKRSR